MCLSADKVLRDAFQELVVKHNKSTYPLPSTLFNLNERTKQFAWPGLEGRFKDFAAGASWTAEQLQKSLPKTPTSGKAGGWIE